MNVDENGPFAKATFQNMAGFIFLVTRYEYDNKGDNLQKPPPWKVT